MMPITVNFTSAEIERLRTLQEKVRGLGNAAGAGAEIYVFLIDTIMSRVPTGDASLPPMNKLLLAKDFFGEDALPVQLLTWLFGARQVNLGEGPFSTVIREYMQVQGQARLGRSFSSEELNKASNDVALLVAETSIDRATLPTIDLVGERDLAALKQLFPGMADKGQLLEQNQTWPGTLLLGAQGGKFLGNFVANGDPASADRLGDLQNMVLSVGGFERAWYAAVSPYSLLGLPSTLAIAFSIKAWRYVSVNPAGTFRALMTGQHAATEAALSLVLDVGEERMVDMLFGSLDGQARLGFTTDSNFAARSKAFFDNWTPAQLQTTAARFATAEELRLLARADVNARAALAGLSPVLLETKTPADPALSLFDAISGAGNLSEQWIDDRAAMLSWLLKPGTSTNGGFVNVTFATGIATFKDYASGAHIRVNPGEGVPDSQGPGGPPSTTPDVTLHDDQAQMYLFGSRGNDTITGSRNADRIYGDTGADLLKGAAGSDWIEGGLGDDVLEGDGGVIGELAAGQHSDTLYGGQGNDKLHGGAGSDLLLGGNDNDELHGDAGNDYLNGGTGADQLWGGADNDFLFDEGGSDANTLKGEDGNDVLEIKGGTGAAFLDGGADNDILVGGQGDNSLDGGSGNDSITGGAGYDIINGGADADFVDAGGGNDRIKGDAGADYLKGGAGNDQYLYETENFGVDLLEDTQGKNEISFAGGSMGEASYDPAKMAWIGANNVEIRKYELGSTTTLALSKTGDKLNTVYLHDWKPGQYGITLSGAEQLRTRPNVTPVSAVSRADNNYVDVIVGSASDGGQGNDLLFGVEANNMLIGGIDNDLMGGRDGDDWLEGGEGTDFLITGEGKDVAYGGIGNDILHAGGSLSLGLGVDTSTGKDVLYWTDTNAGFLYDNQTGLEFSYSVGGQTFYIRHPELAVFNLDFKARLSVTESGAGYLWWMDAASASTSLEPSLDITVTLGNTEFVRRDGRYSEAPSSDFGKPRELELRYGVAGNNLKPGSNREGARLYGGIGDDVVYGANNNDKLYGEADNDLLVGYDGDDELYGGEGKDELSGGAGRDFLNGGANNDQLVGGQGADVLFGEDGNDKLSGDALLVEGTNNYPVKLSTSLMGGDYLQGGAGDDTLWGNHGDDHLFGGTEADLIFGGEGEDHAFGESGDDILDGGEGADYLDGGADKDTLYGDAGNDMLLGGSGEDLLVGGEGDDILDGGADQDFVFGDEGRDHLRGGGGSDFLFGDGSGSGDDADILEGGAGDDKLFGGGKSDMYVFAKGDGRDIVHDDGASGARNALVFKLASHEVRSLSRQEQDLVISYGVDDQVTIKDYYASMAFSHASPGATAGASEGEAQAAIAEIRFEDGTVWGTEEILARAPAPEPGELPPDPFADVASIYFVNALLSREVIKSAGKHALSFSFGNTAAPGVSGVYAFNEAQKQAVREALTRFSAVLDLSFTELPDGTNADLSFHLDDLMSADLGGAAGYAVPASGEVHLNSSIYSRLRQNEFNEFVTKGSLNVGQSGFEVLLHEIGHALGLKHPFETPVLPTSEDNTANTVMSYTSSSSPATALAAFDIAALQRLYGVAAGLNSGDNRHDFSTRWVQDSGGKDSFDASSETQNLGIDLRPGSWSFKGEKAASILADKQTFISHGTLIEDAYGGSGNDSLTGNDAANLLHGGAGADSLQGGQGNDTLVGGDGDDWLAGDAGDDSLQGEAGSDVYEWGRGSGKDQISEALDSSPVLAIDTLKLAGGLEASKLHLSRNDAGDLLVFSRLSDDQLTIKGHFSGRAIERFVFADGTVWDAAAIAERLNQPLTEGNDYYRGDDAANVVDGLGGNDTLNGNGGSDQLYGGQGNDVLSGDSGDDFLSGGDGNDTLVGGAGDDTISGDAGKDVLTGSSGSDVYIYGRGDGNDTLDFRLDEDQFITVKFRGDVAPSDIEWKGWYSDLSVGIRGTTDTLYIPRNYAGTKARGDTSRVRYEFADGTRLTGAEVEKIVFAGTDGNDLVSARHWGSSLFGGLGQDTLYGADGDDTLDGGAGIDSLVGGIGDDVLMNGERMYGGRGNDTYVIDGWSIDSTVHIDESGADSLLLPEGVTPANIKVENYRDGGLRLSFVGAQGRTSTVLIEWQFTSRGDYEIENIKFRDGTVWTMPEVVARAPVSNLSDASDFSVLGFWWDEVINAKGGDDHVSGLDGNDLIDGGQGNDTLLGNHGNDTLIGGGGDDALYGDDYSMAGLEWGQDTLDGGSGNDTLYGGFGDDSYMFRRQSGTDQVNEKAGNDRILIEAGILPANVTLYNDSDDLVLMLDDGRTNLRVSNQFHATYTDGKIESIVFADGTVWDQAYIAANAFGGGVANTHTGTAGDDAYTVDHRLDMIVEGQNQGTDTVTSSTSFRLPSHVENLTLTGVLPTSGDGNALANLIIGNSGANRITSDEGRDTLKGGAGDDFYDIEIHIFETQYKTGSVVVIEEKADEGVDTVLVNTNDYTLPENVENLVLTNARFQFVQLPLGTKIRDSFVGNALPNVMDASALTHWIRLDGGAGADMLIGGQVNNLFIVTDSDDTLISARSAAIDTIEASISWSLADGFENLTLVGAEALTGTGNGLANLIDGSGNSAANVLTGGLGDDSYVLGAADTVVEHAGGGKDSVMLNNSVEAIYRLEDYAHVEGLSIGDGMGASTLLGGAGDDSLVGNGRSNLLDGGAGSDRIADQPSVSLAGSPYLMEQSDTLIGGEGDDHLTSFGGWDYLDGGRGNDTIQAIAVDTRNAQLGVNVRTQKGDGVDLVTGNRFVAVSIGGWTLSDLRASAQNQSYLLSFGDGTDRLTIDNENRGVSLKFDDGTYVSAAGFASLLAGGGRGPGTDGADFLIGSNAADVLTGLAGDDTIYAGGGDDLVNGGDGINELFGGEGNDTLTGGADTDSIYGGSGNDWIDVKGQGLNQYGNHAWGGQGQDTLMGGEGTDYLRGDEGADELHGGLGDDRLEGGAGDDSLYGEGGSDGMSGGDGNDYLIGGTSSRGEAGNDTLIGTMDADQLDGGGDEDSLDGVQGNDTLTGWSGRDTLRGGAGNDYVDGGMDDDVYSFARGDGADTLSSDYADGSIDELRFDAGIAQGDLTLTQSGEVDLLISIKGTTDSILVTGFQNEGAPLSVIRFADGSFWTRENMLQQMSTIRGSSGADSLSGGARNDSLYGLDGNDTLRGGAGDDLLDGGSGTDRMIGGLGSDSYIVDASSDVLVESLNEGWDTVFSTASYTLGNHLESLQLQGSANINATGNALDNVLIGNEGKNQLNGGAGKDQLSGGAGNDTLDGGAGSDIMLGGLGDDSYVVNEVLVLDADGMWVSGDEVKELGSEGNDTVLASIDHSLRQAVENLTLTGSANLSGTGNELANVLTGNSGANVLRGGAGDDSLNGGTGIDTLHGGSGNDSYTVDASGDLVVESAGEGIDSVLSSVSYSLTAHVENLTLIGSGVNSATGNELANLLIGNGANNTLTGKAGNDSLDGGAGNDTMLGGTGDDLYIVNASGDVVTENAEEGMDTVQAGVSYTLAANVESLTLTGTGAINATGNTAANLLIGNAGNNVLTGGAGNDTMQGGAGNDSYVVDAAGDVVIENAEEGMDLVNASVSYALPGHIEQLTLTGTAAISGSGNVLANLLTGNTAANTLSGGAGDDTLNGGAGNDTLVGGSGNDSYIVDATGDLITELADEGVDSVSSSVSHTLAAHVENLSLTGTAALSGTGNALANALTGNSGNNNLSGGAGNDTIDGGAGNDTMVGGSGDDVYTVNVSGDVVTELANEGVDTVYSAVTMSLAANLENLALTGTVALNGTGNAVANALTGNAAANSLSGLAGNDTLDGGLGNDTLNGGLGADTYVFGRGYGADLIIDNDATSGVNDVVAFAAGIVGADIQFSQSGNALVATVRGSSDTLSIQDWYLGTQNRVELFRFADGSSLTGQQAQALVGAMAVFDSGSASAAFVANDDQMRHTGLAVSGGF